MYTLFLASLLFFPFAPPPAKGKLIDRTAALVNSAVITSSDIALFKKQIPIRKELDPFIAFFSYVPKSNKEILRFLVQETLILEKHKASPEDTDQEIGNIMRDNSLSLDVLQSVLASQNVSFENYRKIVGLSIAKRRMIDRDLRPLAIITEDEVKNFYYTQKEFTKNKKGNQLLISFDVLQVQSPDSETARAIYSELSKGADLDTTIGKYLDKGVRKVELGVIREDQLAKPIRKSLNGLKIGDSSTPVSLGSLYVIHKIKSISAPHDPVYEELKQQIRSILFQRALKQQLVLWTERALVEAYIHIPRKKW